MTNEQILNIAVQQSALESGCRAQDFFEKINKTVELKEVDAQENI